MKHNTFTEQNCLLNLLILPRDSNISVIIYILGREQFNSAGSGAVWWLERKMADGKPENQ